MRYINVYYAESEDPIDKIKYVINIDTIDYIERHTDYTLYTGGITYIHLKNGDIIKSSNDIKDIQHQLFEY